MSDRYNVKQILKTYNENNQNIRKTARVLNIHRRTVDRALEKARKNGLLPVNNLIIDGTPQRKAPIRMQLPPLGKVKRYVLTCAQNNTHAHEPTVKNLIAIASYYGAQLIVSKFTYNKTRYRSKSVKPGSEPTAEDCAALWYDNSILPYCPPDHEINDVLLAPGLLWCARANIEPTAARPLRGFHTYAGKASGIFPHTKMTMAAVPVMAGQQPRHNYTTGCCTQQNYIQKRAGLIAEHHHCYGGLLVEVDHEGRYFVRQLNMDANNVMFDLCLRVENGQVHFDEEAVAGITWADVHVAQIRPAIFEAIWTPNGMLDALKPKVQFLHDLFDMHSQNHHDNKSFFRQYELHVKKQDSINDEICKTWEALSEMTRPWVKTVVVRSNHDDALDRWCEFPRPGDVQNAEFHSQMKLARLQAIRANEPFLGIEWALTELYDDSVYTGPLHFMQLDESYLCAGIECGVHGHIGPNGMKGTPYAYPNLSMKINVGHFHTAGIVDGCYFSGTCADPDYVKGPRSHSYSHVLIYRNGKRAIITMYPDGQWRAWEHLY